MKRALATLAAAPLLVLAGCGSSDSGTGGGDAALEVSAAFYPLQWVSQQVGGDLVDVRSLTKPGAEPHDLELTPKDVGELAQSDVVLYLKGFQPAVDDAVASQAKDAGFEVSVDADLSLTASEEGHDHAGESADEHADHAHEGSQDPHFWLDPVRFEKVATAVGERFATADPEHAATYRANAVKVVEQLKTLDGEFRTGLAQCASKELVTGHAAFAYLAQRYGLSQEGIAGISPDAEPDAATLRDLAAHIEEHGVKTVYSETLVSPALADTLARETGATVQVLDPLEGITDASKGTDYLEVMRSNLATLEKGQQCR
ncbi:metal ABC transporter substrate-binding protein [Arthrobacter sp. NEB 688]|uniref:metal ABC transporter substrate-binding protein n=1 Tax=Arthrobacter sp. NEB 688 TaxID=904039 RepID=UPI001C209F5B|nr:metal ABC transporter substrate-binding protein [Arthrobacter sp. NEB 688]